jgi:hypothetical protein
MPRLRGYFDVARNEGGYSLILNSDGALFAYDDFGALVHNAWARSGNLYNADRVNFDSAAVFPRADAEVRPVSISAYLCIKY